MNLPFSLPRAGITLTCASPAALLLTVLAGCGSSSDDATPAFDATELPPGAYAVATGDAADPTFGKYYGAPDGSRLLVLDDSAQQAAAMHRRDGNAGWVSAPAVTANTSLQLLASQAIPAATLDAGKVAGSYAVPLAGQGAALFSVSSGGAIEARGTACKLSGKVVPTVLPNALKLTLAATGCGDLPAHADGYLVVDSDHAPAAFRLLVAGKTGPVDLWAYRE